MAQRNALALHFANWFGVLALDSAYARSRVWVCMGTLFFKCWFLFTLKLVTCCQTLVNSVVHAEKSV